MFIAPATSVQFSNTRTFKVVKARITGSYGAEEKKIATARHMVFFCDKTFKDEAFAFGAPDEATLQMHLCNKESI